MANSFWYLVLLDGVAEIKIKAGGLSLSIQP